jgi:hypothetical protein
MTIAGERGPRLVTGMMTRFRARRPRIKGPLFAGSLRGDRVARQTTGPHGVDLQMTIHRAMLSW